MLSAASKRLHQMTFVCCTRVSLHCKADDIEIHGHNAPVNWRERRQNLPMWADDRNTNRRRMASWKEAVGMLCAGSDSILTMPGWVSRSEQHRIFAPHAMTHCRAVLVLLPGTPV